MDSVRSNMRFFFEVFMPGVFLLCNYVLFVVMLLVSWYRPSVEQVKEVVSTASDAGSVAVALVVMIAFGYGLGMVLRLMKVAWVDRMAGEWLCYFTREGQRNFAKEPYFYLDWMEEKLSDEPPRLPRATRWVIDEVWAPYYRRANVASTRSKGSFLCRLFLPKYIAEIAHFHPTWKDAKAAYDSVQKCASENTAIINWCKIVLNKCDSAAARETFEAEWTLRYVAGMVYATRASLWLVLIGSIFPLFSGFTLLGIGGLLLAATYMRLMILILRHFRYLRCKEIESLLGAIHANRKEFRRHLAMIGPPDTTCTRSGLELTRLIKDLWKENGGGPVSLAAFLRAIRSLGDERGTCYFAGAIPDHRYFVVNDTVALGVAVLPQDAVKAGRKRSHPHQTEVILGLQGRIQLWKGSSTQDAQPCVVSAGDIEVIQPNVVHWMQTNGVNESAAYLFVKTHPGKQPSSVDHES